MILLNFEIKIDPNGIVATNIKRCFASPNEKMLSVTKVATTLFYHGDDAKAVSNQFKTIPAAEISAVSAERKNLLAEQEEQNVSLPPEDTYSCGCILQ